MKFAIFLFIAVQLYVVSSKTIPRACSRNDPNYNTCTLDVLQKGMALLAKGIPEYYIPPMDPYVLREAEANVTLEDFARANIKFKDVKVSGILKAKVKDLDIDLNTLSGEVAFYHPEIQIGFKYNGDGKLYDSSLQSEGQLKGKFNDINCNIKYKLKTVEKNGVKYFVIQDFKLKSSIGDGYVNVITKDPEQQALVDFVQELFNKNPQPYLEAFNPVAVKEVETRIRKMLSDILAVVPAKIILPD